MLILGAGVGIALWTHWNQWAAAQRMIALVYMLVPLHVWEEWRIPGGFGYQYNWTMANSERPDRWPMNMLTDMITVFGAQWFGIVLLLIGASKAALISQTFFSFAEVAMHLHFGNQMYRRFKSKGKRTLYNPGLATALVGFLPLFVFGTHVIIESAPDRYDFLSALGLLIIFTGIVFLPERLIKSRPDGLEFSPGYYRRFIEKA
ncbi:HXXEE domain-containing protein [Paraburkholderia bannensis]|uniref:HXXEE domain-containing protein n=1 Tax=Paraburkholderia bannensis TaxID=765414 RepID=UPI002AAF3507|nr:HXXEE domain-containing protein [Paraburkholderia bannensis]